MVTEPITAAASFARAPQKTACAAYGAPWRDPMLISLLNAGVPIPKDLCCDPKR